MVTMKTIATVLGVSDSTVSRALNDHFSIGGETKRKVRKVAKELGYVPNAVARGLNQKRTKTLGLVFPYSLSDPFLARVYHGIEDETLKSGYNQFVCQTGDNQEREQLHLDQLMEKRADGVIVVPASSNYVDDSSLCESVASLRQLGIPIVFIDKYLPDMDVDYVIADYERLAYELVKHLIGLGHRRIGFVGGYDCTSMRDGQRGYRRALADAGIVCEQRFVKNAVLSDSPGGWRADGAVRELAEEDGVTALLLASHKQALELLPAEHAGIERRDVVEFASLSGPGRFWLRAATARMALEEMGRMAAEIIMKYQQGGERTRRQEVVLPSELIFRKAAGDGKARPLPAEI
ncbi:MAG: LacI family DNA-binding transcriptional regulator [Planctomycetota bacterium]|nr:LacI family DNA-binding transcriptional regulator [Planctomycetota bacterium]